MKNKYIILDLARGTDYHDVLGLALFLNNCSLAIQAVTGYNDFMNLSTLSRLKILEHWIYGQTKLIKEKIVVLVNT